jgi:hypothetical protein
MPASHSRPRAYFSCYVLDHDQNSTRTCIPQSVIHIKPQGSTHFFVHSLAVLKNAPLSFFNCCIHSQFRPASPLSNLVTYRCYLRLKRVVRARIIHLFLDDGKYYSNCHTSTRCRRPVFLTCGECDGWLPLLSYPATCSQHHRR